MLLGVAVYCCLKKRNAQAPRQDPVVIYKMSNLTNQTTKSQLEMQPQNQETPRSSGTLDDDIAAADGFSSNRKLLQKSVFNWMKTMEQNKKTAEPTHKSARVTTQLSSRNAKRSNLMVNFETPLKSLKSFKTSQQIQ